MTTQIPAWIVMMLAPVGRQLRRNPVNEHTSGRLNAVYNAIVEALHGPTQLHRQDMKQEDSDEAMNAANVVIRRLDEYDAKYDARKYPTSVHELTEAIRLTVEYVGTEMLPPIEGWSWYDALMKYAPEKAHMLKYGPGVAHLANALAEHRFTDGGPADECKCGQKVDLINWHQAEVIKRVLEDQISDAVNDRVPVMNGCDEGKREYQTPEQFARGGGMYDTPEQAMAAEQRDFPARPGDWVCVDAGDGRILPGPLDWIGVTDATGGPHPDSGLPVRVWMMEIMGARVTVDEHMITVLSHGGPPR